MVCKEDVLLWFKDLDSYKRIDVLYELLNMCLPFELRFLGSCIEELGKHTYLELRGPTLTANDLEKLSNDVSFNQGILDESVRHRVLIYLSLLSSRNYSVASWLYRRLLRTDCVEEFLVKGNGKDEILHSEFLLLFTMALHHPAFTFEQKQFFSRILANLLHFRDNRVPAKHGVVGYPPGFGYPVQKPCLNVPPPSGQPLINELPPLPIDMLATPVVPAQLPLVENLPHSSLPLFNPAPDIKTVDSDSAKFNSIEEKNLREMLWSQASPIDPEIKPNGVCFPPFPGKMPPYLVEQVQALNLDNENSLHHSNSSGSSPNETPPGTPITTPHGQGRGEAKLIANGIPFISNPGPPHILDVTSPPPPFSNSSSSVPYTFPQPFTTLPPNRSIFPYNQACRPTFTTQYPNYLSDNNFSTFTFPYVHLMYSSPYPPRTQPGCFNCGTPNHLGSECTRQNIEEITQKKAYQLEYALPLPDPEK